MALVQEEPGWAEKLKNYFQASCKRAQLRGTLPVAHQPPQKAKCTSLPLCTEPTCMRMVVLPLPRRPKKR